MVAATNAVQGAASTGSAAADRTALAQNYDTFLKLLTTQLQNQDPLTPMDSSQFTNQLVMFSQVEQQIGLNDKLAKMQTAQQTQLTQGALGYIGLDVTVSGNTFQYAGAPVDVGYNLAADAASVTASVVNANGDVVWTGQPKNSTTAGDHTFTWDGKDLSGNTAPTGIYGVAISAADKDGKATAAATTVPGRVTGVETTTSGVMLDVSGTQISINNVISAKLPTA
ncbi:MAG: flagellar hook capping family protein [Rhodospirillales bacterium]|nr:flagellar hook capping family protein [Rhodospirillales bacterium]